MGSDIVLQIESIVEDPLLFSLFRQVYLLYENVYELMFETLSCPFLYLHEKGDYWCPKLS